MTLTKTTAKTALPNARPPAMNPPRRTKQRIPFFQVVVATKRGIAVAPLNAASYPRPKQIFPFGSCFPGNAQPGPSTTSLAAKKSCDIETLRGRN
jgi:hypothetical protein